MVNPSGWWEPGRGWVRLCVDCLLDCNQSEYLGRVDGFPLLRELGGMLVPVLFYLPN